MSADQIALDAQLACIWEATARKPGNVHRFADFADTAYLDFLASAATVAPVIGRAEGAAVGEAVLECVRRTRAVAPANTNLGIVLLLVPLAKGGCEPECVSRVLESLTVADAAAVYEAVRLAKPGGLGEAGEQDVRSTPTVDLRACMDLARDRDLIARQYANGFAEVFGSVAPAILAGVERTGCVEGGIIHAHLATMAAYPDSLIARKRGEAEACEAAARARAVLDAGWPHTETGRRAIDELDGWLRALGNARNPGTTADLMAAALFVLLRTGRLRPGAMPWAM